MTTDDRISTTHGGGIERGRVAVHHESGVAIVTMQGEHDLSTAPHISKALAEARRHSDVVVDLSSCSLIDSTVIGVLVATAADIRAGGENLVLAVPAGESLVTRVVEMTHLAEIFPVHASRAEAVARLAPRP
jgi:anti-sigma B factor antagonist